MLQHVDPVVTRVGSDVPHKVAPDATGGRSALAGKALGEMGYNAVLNACGFKEMADAGLDTEPT